MSCGVYNIDMKLEKKLPTVYRELTWQERRLVREQYIKEQKNKCFFCEESLGEEAPKRITDKKINWDYFPDNFLAYLSRLFLVTLCWLFSFVPLLLSYSFTLRPTLYVLNIFLYSLVVTINFCVF